MFDKSHTLIYTGTMNRTYEYSAEKNQQLIKERNISFEEIVAALNNGQLLDIVEHHNHNRYPNQKIYVVHINDYIFLVPFVEKDSQTIFLKMIFPSRKAKAKYIKEKRNENKKN